MYFGADAKENTTIIPWVDDRHSKEIRLISAQIFESNFISYHVL